MSCGVGDPMQLAPILGVLLDSVAQAERAAG
jgi:hypothetical protein